MADERYIARALVFRLGSIVGRHTRAALMKELLFVNPDYDIRGSDPPLVYEGAHRLTRMALSIGVIIDVSAAQFYWDAFDACQRVESVDDPCYTCSEGAALAELFEAISAGLDAALDDQNRPRAPKGDAIVEEAGRPLRYDDGSTDDDRVFQLEDDGLIGTVYPRMSLTDFRERLPMLAAFLRKAATEHREIVLIG